jgi:membrane glycosyltransferase
VQAYLRAAGVVDDGLLNGALRDIDERLCALLPLREGEAPVEIAMRETVRWVEECRPMTPMEAAAAEGPTPPREGLPMPEQTINLKAWRRGAVKSPRDRKRAAATPAAAEAGPARGIRARRTLWASLIIATTAGAVGLMSGSMLQDGLSPLELLLIVLYALLFSWICAAFWTACTGFVIRLLGIRRWDVGSGVAERQPSTDCCRQSPRCALIMPIYNENPAHVFARLRAIRESLAAADATRDFDLYVLSDTRDPDVQIEEELHWARLSSDTQAGSNIYYRHRAENTYRKAGNIADFLRSWGGRYRYMAILDADSLMSGRTLSRMVDIMEARPKVAILQAPPVPVNNRSLFARLLQFASGLYGPLYTAGMNFWQAGDASYFGHNALIRVEPFARYCGLPSLPGSEPLGGPILSHDFVEAATLRRAGWETWLADGLEGSYEEIPPNLIEYAKRDRRWCQGNLQHGRLVSAAGWRGLSRLHFVMAVMSYLASPLWFLFLLAAGVEAWLQSREEPVYFFGHSLFPVWPTSYTFELMTVLLVTLSILFLPKILALALLVAEPRRSAAFGGARRASFSALLESIFSAIAAPVLMLFQTKFVAAILLRKNVGWPAQQRAERATTLAQAFQAHGSQLAVGVIAGVVAWHYVPTFFWWFTPVLAGMVLAVPVSMLTSRADLGEAARRAGLFLTPEEVWPPEIIRRYRNLLEKPPPAEDLTQLKPLWLAALLHPRVHAVHRRMLPDEQPTRGQRLHLEALMYTLADQSADALSPADRREMLANAECLRRMHIGLWSELPLERLRQTMPGGALL